MTYCMSFSLNWAQMLAASGSWYLFIDRHSCAYSWRVVRMVVRSCAARECASAAESPVVVRPDANAARLADPIPVQANSFSDCCRTELQRSQHILRLQSTLNVLSSLLTGTNILSIAVIIIGVKSK